MSITSFYERRIFPWLNDKLTNDPDLQRVRREVLAAARGRVIEIGFGSGANLPYYPPTVRAVVGIEPNGGMLDRWRLRLSVAPMPVRIVVGVAEALPFANRTFDTAVSTLTLCSVADPGGALAELRRVLKDDGALMVIEHGLSLDERVARWQHRLDGIQGMVACGCHLVRPIPELIKNQQFAVDRLQSFYAPRIPRTHGWITSGTAIKC